MRNVHTHSICEPGSCNHTGLLLDRIDIHVEVPRAWFAGVTGTRGACLGANADMGLSEVREYCKLDDAGKVLGRWEIATTMASNLLDLVPVVYPVLEADVRRAVELFREYAPQGVTIRDVLHAAVMQNNGIAQIISTDEHFDRIEGITRLDPRTLFGLAHRKPS